MSLHRTRNYTVKYQFLFQITMNDQFSYLRQSLLKKFKVPHLKFFWVTMKYYSHYVCSILDTMCMKFSIHLQHFAIQNQFYPKQIIFKDIITFTTNTFRALNMEAQISWNETLLLTTFILWVIHCTPSHLHNGLQNLWPINA